MSKAIPPKFYEKAYFSSSSRGDVGGSVGGLEATHSMDSDSTDVDEEGKEEEKQMTERKEQAEEEMELTEGKEIVVTEGKEQAEEEMELTAGKEIVVTHTNGFSAQTADRTLTESWNSSKRREWLLKKQLEIAKSLTEVDAELGALKQRRKANVSNLIVSVCIYTNSFFSFFQDY
jgi:hypothetical protein